MSTTFEDVFTFAVAQLRRLIEAHPGAFPMYTTQGRWDFSGEAWTNWCEGFLGGQLWLLHLHTGDPYWRAQAEKYTLLLEPRQHDRTVHDLGFIFMPTYLRWYDLTGDSALLQVLIQAGRTLAWRFQPRGGYLCSFLGENSLFIDIMMNVPLIFYAAQKASDPELERLARQHCLTTRKYLVRGDGSTVHEGLFDTATGEFLRPSTQQGWRPDSCWGRGLAWALYGFALVYTYTHDPCFLQTAQSCADYYLQHTPEHGIPPNDWDEPSPALQYESSAAVIAAGGLLLLSQVSLPWAAADRYRQAALCILETLCTPEFLAVDTPGWEGLLKHGIYHPRKRLGVDESVMWGDYFFLDALYTVLHGS